VWIVVLAVLLGGVVALNVAVLQLNVQIDRLTRERASIRADNQRLEVRLSTAAAAPRIEVLAHKRLGLVQVRPEATTYIDLRER
jgi:cell division protein FtsL